MKEPMFNIGDHVHYNERNDENGQKETYHFVVSSVRECCIGNWYTYVYDLKTDENDDFPVMVSVDESKLFKD